MENIKEQNIQNMQKEESNEKNDLEEKLPKVYATADELMEKEIIPWLESLELE